MTRCKSSGSRMSPSIRTRSRLIVKEPAPGPVKRATGANAGSARTLIAIVSTLSQLSVVRLSSWTVPYVGLANYWDSSECHPRLRSICPEAGRMTSPKPLHRQFFRASRCEV
jgi:hypothetical protein